MKNIVRFKNWENAIHEKLGYPELAESTDKPINSDNTMLPSLELQAKRVAYVEKKIESAFCNKEVTCSTSLSDSNETVLVPQVTFRMNNDKDMSDSIGEDEVLLAVCRDYVSAGWKGIAVNRAQAFHQQTATIFFFPPNINFEHWRTSREALYYTDEFFVPGLHN